MGETVPTDVDREHTSLDIPARYRDSEVGCCKYLIYMYMKTQYGCVHYLSNICYYVLLI